MEAIEVSSRVFGFADRHARNVNDLLAMPDFGESPTDAAVLGMNVQMMGAMWQLASSMVKDLTEPLKSIVNK
nr:hypothetical protein [uncultured Limnobacter sp.]